MAASAIELVMLLSASKCLVMLCSAAEVNMRKLAFPKSVEGISDEKVKSDFSKSYSAEDKAIKKLLGDVAQNCHKKNKVQKRQERLSKTEELSLF